MEEYIPLCSPFISEEEINSVADVIRSGNLVQGKKVAELENNICEYLEIEYCIAVTNGTSTLHLILNALNIGFGDEVILPAFSYIATANVIELVGAKPIFVDIDNLFFNIDKNLIIDKITPKTKAIIVVHEFGLSADIKDINKICIENNLFLIEDAACALGAKDQGQFVGTFGIAGSFSFHPRKAITSGEGGAIVTNNKELAAKLKTLRNHGIDSENGSKIDFILPGFNCRMTDIQAAMLIGQLGRFKEILSKRSSIVLKYLSGIKNDLIILPTFEENKIHTWQTFHVLLKNPLKQKDVIKKLNSVGIGTNYGAQCIPIQSFYQAKYKIDVNNEHPNALLAYECGLALPLFEKMTKNQIEKVITEINKLN